MLLTVIIAFAGAQTAGAEIIGEASGTCGDNLSWTLTENGEDAVTWANGTTGHTALTLTITGSGNMADYKDTTVPWKSDRQSITRITLPDGLTCIGNYAFSSCKNVKSISIPALVSRIGQNALGTLGNKASSCTVKFAEGSQLTSIGANAFEMVNADLDMTNCTQLTVITAEEVFKAYTKTVTFSRTMTSVCDNAFKKISGGGMPTIMMAYDGILRVNGTTVAEGTGTATITDYFNVTTSGSDAVTMYVGGDKGILNLGPNVTVSGYTVVVNSTTYYYGTVTLGYSGTVGEGGSVKYAVNGEYISDNTFAVSGDATVTAVVVYPYTDISRLTYHGGTLIDINGTTYTTEPDGYYEINDEQDLIDLGRYVIASKSNNCAGLTFKLNRDLDFSGLGNNPDCHDKSGRGAGNFLPIGLAAGTSHGGAKFAGSFYGQGHSIIGLRFSYEGDMVGLFCGINDASAVIEGVTLVSPNFSAQNYVGGIVGTLQAGNVRECAVVGGTISADNSYVGGIVGYSLYIQSTDKKSIVGCTVVGTTVSGAGKVGIIVGANTGNSSATAALTIKSCTYHDPDDLRVCGSGSYTKVSTQRNYRVYQLTLGEGVTATGATYSHTLVPDKAYYEIGDNVTLGHGNRDGYVFGGYSASPAQTISDGSFTMPEEDVSVSATWAPDPDDFAVSSDGKTYTINTAAGWGVFCDALQDLDTYNRFSGKTVKLEPSDNSNGITVTRMAGSSQHDFCGTFDGGGHTITLAIGSAESPFGEDYAALFRNVTTTKADPNDTEDSPASIHSLVVEGDIYTSKQFAAGIVANQFGTVTISNCRSSVVIHSSKQGDGTHGGIVAVKGNSSYAKLTIEGCVFDGKIVSTGTGEDATTHCGGFVGYKRDQGSLTIRNSLYAPQADASAVTDGATFARNWSMPADANCYYTATLGSAQGKQPHSVTAGANVTIEPIALTGDETAYDVSGITAYSGGGIHYGDNLYYGSGDAVSLTLADDATDAPTGYASKDGYTVSAGTLSGSTLTMPDKDVVVTVRWAPDPSHFAVNADGTEYTIKTATGWNVFCDALQDLNTYNRFSGKTVTLYGDIPTADEKAAGTTAVTRMAGTSQHDFCGTFDGGGHTLSVNLSSTYGQDYTAPFSYVSTVNSIPAAIRNLNVTGTVNASKNYASGIVGAFWGTLTIEDCTSSVTINTGNKHAAGFIGHARGDVTLRNCLSSVTINSSVGGDGTHGGLIGSSVSGKTFTIEGCAFTGSLLSTGTGDAATTKCGGFVGWNGGTLNIRNSLFAPASVSVGASNSATFSRYDDGSVTNIDNCYYTQTLGTEQGEEGILLFDGGVTATTNEGVISRCATKQYDVKLQDRTLYKDGNWNTLCLPFDVTIADSPLAGATVKKLTASTSNLTNGVLTLNFEEETTTLHAGTPYIIKWASGDNLVDPEFTGVTISSTTPTAVEFSIANSSDKCQFVGQYSPFDITAANKDEIIMLGSGNKLGYSKNPRTLRSFRAHFEIPTNDGTPAAREFVLDFGDESTSLREISNEQLVISNYDYYTLDGRKLDGKPTKKGMYIVNGKKIVVK